MSKIAVQYADNNGTHTKYFKDEISAYAAIETWEARDDVTITGVYSHGNRLTKKDLRQAIKNNHD